MKIFARLPQVILIAVLLVVAGRRAEGQILNFSVTSSSSAVMVSNALTFTINVTNFNPIDISNLTITDSLPSSVQITSFNVLGVDGVVGVIQTNIVTFSLFIFPQASVLNITVTTEPDAAGLITNTVTISSPDLFSNAVANLVVDVTNTIVDANLGVSLPSQQPVFTNDLTAYTITVTNAGPDDAPNVMMTNMLPPGVILESVSPTNQAFTIAGSNLLFNLGTIASGSSSNVQINLEPTNSGVLPYSASVGSASVANISALPTTATNSLTVLTFVSGVLTAVTNSGQSINFQNGLEEQSILLSNISATNVTAARVIVTDLPRQLYNAVGTNSGNPFVVYTAPLAAPLAPGQSISLLLQYNPRGSFPFTNSQLQAFPVPLPNLTPPVTTATSTNINISGIFRLPGGNILIEFPATPGQAYTVVYSDNAAFSNSMVATPAIVAPANILQWIDYGPPATVAAPTNTSARFYRIIQNP
jgi:uncharacterized repeat protein (TIGR01451 family)